MNGGMLWFDNNPKTTLCAKVEMAADYYRKKYGRDPNLCLVNPMMMGDKSITQCKIQIRAFRPVLRNHLWIGVEEK